MHVVAMKVVQGDGTDLPKSALDGKTTQEAVFGAEVGADAVERRRRSRQGRRGRNTGVEVWVCDVIRRLQGAALLTDVRENVARSETVIEDAATASHSDDGGFLCRLTDGPREAESRCGVEVVRNGGLRLEA